MLGEGRWDMNNPTFSVAQMGTMYNQLLRSRGYSDPTGLAGGMRRMAEDYNAETNKLLREFCALYTESMNSAQALSQFADQHSLKC